MAMQNTPHTPLGDVRVTHRQLLGEGGREECLAKFLLEALADHLGRLEALAAYHGQYAHRQAH